ncbi:MAG: lysoplasmalogenase, partial [Robiginitomaculum sp.]|nr:lysoplasmalogenase [Robiginitomaculum sp.]
MGIAALTTALSLLVPIGALLFIASDVVLAVERFKFKFPLDKKINWALYASGQIVLAIGVVG